MSTLRQRPTTARRKEEALAAPRYGARDRGVPVVKRLCILLGFLVPPILFSSSFRSLSETNSGHYAVCSNRGLNIHTVDENNTRVQCMVIRGAYIVDVGALSEVQERWSQAVESTVFFWKRSAQPALQVHFLQEGCIVVPGLSDSHAHVLEYGAFRTMPLEPAQSIEAAVAVVKDYILSNADVLDDKTQLIEGWGWDHTIWPTQRWPTAADLDSEPVIRGRRVILHSKDGHALWVSSQAIEDSMPLSVEVDGGFIDRDTSGSPKGLFLDNAQDLIRNPPTTEETLKRRFARTIKDAISLGLTSIHDAGLDPISLEFFKRQSAQGNLPVRIYGMTYYDENAEYWGNKTSPLIAEGDGRLSVRSVKMFADGALRTGGAALYEPYADNPGSRGLMRLSSEIINTVIPQFLRDGWQVNVHAIGDRANAIVLDSFEAALENVNVTALRPRLEHAQFLTEADMKRVGRLGVIASIQPTHVISDMWYAESRLGPKRVAGLYAFRSLVDSGALITLGSDFPVEDMNPLAGFYAAITRTSPTGSSPHGPDGWFPEQRLTRQEALRALTIMPAYASFTESTLGSIEIGKRADFVILSQDIMNIPVDTILNTKVLATVIDGKPVYGQL